MLGSRRLNVILTALILILVSPLAAPELLAFPHSATVGAHRIYSVRPIERELTQIIAKADRRVETSALGSARPLDQRIFLTDGGWRWYWLAALSRSAFALTRPLSEAVIVNRSDVQRDRVANGRPIAGTRTLGGTLAHEMTHGAIRAHFGLLADLRYSAELREGYCDHVAGGGSLGDDEALALVKAGKSVPALAYWRGRKRVEAALAANGGSVDALFANWRA